MANSSTLPSQMSRSAKRNLQWWGAASSHIKTWWLILKPYNNAREPPTQLSGIEGKSVGRTVCCRMRMSRLTLLDRMGIKVVVLYIIVGDSSSSSLDRSRDLRLERCGNDRIKWGDSPHLTTKLIRWGTTSAPSARVAIVLGFNVIHKWITKLTFRLSRSHQIPTKPFNHLKTSPNYR